MKVEHLALWVDDLEKMRQFYLAYFNMISSDKHVNDGKGVSFLFPVVRQRKEPRRVNDTG